MKLEEIKSMDIAALSAQGKRENNEDTYRMEHADEALMLLVADGLGGHEGGEEASMTAAEVCASCFHAYPKATEENVRRMFEAAEDAVEELQKEKNGNMRTTLTIFLASPEGMLLAHAGDTRGYFFSGGKILYQTPDHSVAGQSVLLKELKEKKIRSSPDRHKLLRTIGGGSVRPAVHMLPNDYANAGGAPQTAVLLCSDGFWENVTEKEMLRTLKKAESAADWLRRMEEIIVKRDAPGQDNYTAVAAWLSTLA